MIIVFSRRPEPGQVKTRMLTTLSGEAAAQLHKELSDESLATCEPAQTTLFCHPSIEGEYFAGYRRAGFALRNQVGADLGERMSNAITQVLEEGAQTAILIGTDCPPIDRNHLDAAARALVDHDVVISPAEDGGYGLIGMRRSYPEVFEDIAWGTGGVCAETCRKMNDLGLSYALMPMIWDVDVPSDLERYREWQSRQVESD